MAPPGGRIIGAYTVRATSLVLGAALAADAPVWGMRLGPTSTRKAFVTGIQLDFDTLVAFTAAQQFGLYLQRFSAANLAGGSAVTPVKLRSGDPASDCLNGGAAGGDARVAGAAALTSAGVAFDGASPVPLIGWTDPSANKKTTGQGLWLPPDMTQPIELLPGEGICLRNLIVWPAAGTGVVTASVSWYEA